MVNELVSQFLQFWAPPATRRTRTRQSSLPAIVQTLEPRQLLVGNLQLTDVALLNGQGQEISAPVVGQMIYVQASWKMDDLTTNDKYVVRFDVDGVALDSEEFTAVAGTGITAGKTLFGWYTFPGLHTVTVTVDALNKVAETNEADNSSSFFFAPAAPETLPDKFGSPIGGQPFEDWSIVNYNDTDPRAGTAFDFRGGAYTADVNDGWDITLANFARMDRGMPILATADGVVSAVTDGNFDRETAPNNRPRNFVTIDHGDGWVTSYGNLAAGTITVNVGDSVVKGQIIGFTGSSGNSTAAHLHFTVLHEGALVETSYAPDLYWDNPWEYQGDLPPTVVDMGFTDINPFTPNADIVDRPAEKNVFSRGSDNGKEMWFWFNITTIPKGTDFNVRFVRPDSVIAGSFTQVPTEVVRSGSFGFFVNSSVWRQMTGAWTVELRVDNQLVTTKQVTVTNSAAPVEMRIRDAGNLIVNGRTTALDIPTSRTFTIENYGGSTLFIDSIQTPDGFVALGVPTSVSAGGSATFQVAWTGVASSTYIGDVVIKTNDATDPVYAFRIGRNASAAPPAETPTVTLSSSASAAFPGNFPVPVDPLATTGDIPVVFNSRLTVEIVSGFQFGDELSLILPDYEIDGPFIRKSGNPVAVITALSDNRIDIQFDTAATLADRQEILRGVSFAASVTPGRSGQRIVRVAVIDADGVKSPYAYHTFDVPGALPPTDIALDNDSIPENEPVGTNVGVFTTTDPDVGDTFTYQLVAGEGSDDNAKFSLGAFGLLKTAEIFDRETQASFSIRVRSTDQNGTYLEKVFTIGAENVNEDPTNILLSNSNIVEGKPINTIVGGFSTADPDVGNTFTYTLVGGSGSTNNGSFTIDGSGNLRSNAVFNLATKSSYSIRVQSKDQGGLAVEKVFVITILTSNVAPTNIGLTNSSVAENQAIDTVVGTFSTTDANVGNTFAYTLVAGDGATDNGSFTIDGTGKLKTGAIFNFEAKNSYFIRVRSTDQGNLWVEKAFVISVSNVNEKPTNVALSNAGVEENKAVGTTVGQFSTTDPDASNTFTYTLVSTGTFPDNASFTIDGNVLKTAAVFNFEVKNSYSIRVRTTDQGGEFFEKTFTITVSNANEVPTNITLSNASVAENKLAGTTVGVFTSTDGDAGNTFTYTLVAGTGSTDNSSFTIDAAGNLKTAAVFNFETKTAYSIRVKTTDNTGLAFEKVFEIHVTNVNEAPTAIALSKNTVLDKQAVGTTVGTFSTTDPDAGNTFGYTLVAGDGSTDNARFAIDGGNLRTAAVFDAAVKSSYTIRVRSTDQGGLPVESVFLISVTPSTALSAAFSNIASVQTSAVGVVTVTFNRAVTGVGLNDFSLTRNGDTVGLSGATFTAVSATKYTIDLSSKTAAAGNYVFTLKAENSGIKDQFNGLLPANTVAKWLNQQVTQFVVQNGQLQNSYIRYLDVTFASAEGLDAMIAANRIKLTKFSLEGTNGVNVAIGTVTRNGNTLRFNFGENGLGGNRTSNAGDGYYQISFNVTGNEPQALKKSFYRLLGDANGDRKVDSGDYNLILSQIGKPYDANYDILGLGRIDTSYLSIITANQGRKLKSTLQVDG